jgi:pyruvate carboxylase
MRVVESEADFNLKWIAISEAIAALEMVLFYRKKCVFGSRHIEIQIMDSHLMCCIYSKENAASSVVTKSD